MKNGGVDDREAEKMTGMEASGFLMANNISRSKPLLQVLTGPNIWTQCETNQWKTCPNETPDSQKQSE